MFESLWKFVNYWYFRYLLVTELYMVDKWERVMIHIVLLIFVTILSLFNSTVVLGLIKLLYDSLYGQHSEIIQPEVISNNY